MNNQKFKGTKGGVEIFMGNYGTFCTINKDVSTRICTIQIGYGNVSDIVEATANANAMTEAINVAGETGLTPRQLLQQRNELLADLKNAIERMERARGILKRNSDANWGMLDTSDLVKSIEI